MVSELHGFFCVETNAKCRGRVRSVSQRPPWDQEEEQGSRVPGALHDPRWFALITQGER